MIRITDGRAKKLLSRSAAVLAAGLVLAAPVQAQDPVTRHACYLPGTGTVYLIKEPGTKQTCTAPAHVAFTFTDGAGALRPGDAAGGDLLGSLPAPKVKALQGRTVSAVAPAEGDLLTWNEATGEWEPKPAPAGGGEGGDHGSLSGLTNDDHPQYLLLDGHRHTTGGGFAISGTFGLGKLPVSGPGGRFMYSTTVHALRFGTITPPHGDGWDLPNLGLGSVAMGSNVRAHANHSIVFGTEVFAGPRATGAIVLGANRNPFSLIGTDTPYQVYVYAEGGVVFQTLAEGSAGSSCELKPGAGAWQCSSDVAAKTDFDDVDPETVLRGVAALPITRWRYRGEPDSVRHMGPTAQDFRAAFGLGDGEKHIGVLDAAGVSLAANKALAARTSALAEAGAEMRTELLTLRADVGSLRSELQQMRSAYDELLARLAALESAGRDAARPNH